MSDRPTPSRGRRIAAAVAVAIGALVLVVVPIWQYVDAVTVPSGSTAERAEVLETTTPHRVTGGNSRFRGRTVSVRLPDRTEDTVYLGRRLNFPDPGDELTVYDEDGELRTTAEVSRLAFVPGAVAVVFAVPVLAAWVTRRRGRASRAGNTDV